MAECNENASKKLNFAYCFRPIHYFARVGGQMPFTITYSANGATVGAKVYKRDLIWSTISLCIHIFFIYDAIEDFKSIGHSTTNMTPLVVCNLSMYIISLLFGISVMALDFANRFKIVKMLHEITIFDKEVRK